MRLIDADAIIKKWENVHCKDISFEMAVIGAINDIKKAPTVDAVPVRHGKWARENNYGIWKCSECGCKVNRANPLKGNIWNYNYCPNCGARMDEE